MKNALILTLAGALAGIAVAAFIAPPLLGWYTSPGGLPDGAQVQAVVQIPEVIRFATSRLIWAEAIGAAVGAVLGLAIYFLARRPAPPPPPPPVSTPAPRPGSVG